MMDSRHGTRPRATGIAFPEPPPDAWTDALDVDAARRFLRDALTWRGECVRHLRRTVEECSGADSLEAWLLWALGAGDQPATKALPYAVSAFPEDTTLGALRRDARDSDARAAVVAILRWRAAIIDVLADAWDTVGPGIFDMEACAAAELLFMPLNGDSSDRCAYCLLPVQHDLAAPEDITHYATCPARVGPTSQGGFDPWT